MKLRIAGTEVGTASTPSFSNQPTSRLYPTKDSILPVSTILGSHFLGEKHTHVLTLLAFPSKSSCLLPILNRLQTYLLLFATLNVFDTHINGPCNCQLLSYVFSWSDWFWLATSLSHWNTDVYSLSTWQTYSQGGRDLFPRGHLMMCRDIFPCHNWVSVTDI